MNRFKDCKSLIDLHNVLADVENVTFDNLSAEEAERLVLVFSANTDDTMALPLTDEKFVYICAKARAHAIDVATNVLINNKFEEDSTMNKTIFTHSDEAVKAAVNAAADAISRATEDVKVRAGMDTEEFKEKADSSITTIKDATMGVLGALDRLTGATTLKNALLHILYQNTRDRSSKRGFFDAANECRRVVYNYIDGILEFDPDENDFRTVIALRYMLGEDEAGKPTGRRSIFTAFANGIVWICKKVARKFKAWFGTNEESNIFGTVGASLASIFGMVAGVIGSVLKVAAHAVVFVGSYVVGAIIKAISFIWDKLKGFGTFLKKKFGKDDEADDEAVDVELYEELR